jgi:hypothetical protein
MGLFDINIPLIYGEAHKAFLRLQQEILKVSDDQSLFAWGIPKFLGRLEQPFGQPADQTTTHGLFADSPSDFATDYEVITLLGEKDIEPPVLYGNGLRVKFPSLGEESIKYILLACTIRGSLEWYLGIPLRQWHPIYTARCGDPALIPASRRSSARNDAVVVRPLESNLLSSYPATFTIVRVPDLSDLSLNDYFDLDEIYCLPHGTYNPAHRRISFPTGAQGPHAALFFVPSTRRKDLRPRLGSQRPISGLPSFVIALGSYESAWAEACVIIQDDSTLPATWDSATEQLPVRKVFCRQPMTKEAFKARLNSNNPREPCLMTQEHNDWKAEDQIEYTITSSTDGFLSPWSNRFCQHIVRLRCWGISICIRLETRALNLVETTVYVSINIHMEYTEKVYDVRRITKNNLVQLLNKRQPMPVKSKTVYHDKQLVDHNFKPD